MYTVSMDENNQIEISPFRLRVGVVCIFLWWIPVWAAAPAIAAWFDYDNDKRVTIVLMTIQTVIGGIGIFVAGKQIIGLFNKIPRKKVPKTVWRMIISGKTEVI